MIVFVYLLNRFDSSVAPLIFADQFIKFSTRLSTPLLYGLGEHQQPLLINVTNEWKRLTFYSRDFPPMENINLYGPTVENVIEQYWAVTGKPTMPPFWSLGFHLCRWGYNNIENMISTLERMQSANFPIDVQWTDIDAMSSYLDFTYDSEHFHGLPGYVRALQADGIHYVNIIDPGISSTQSAGSYIPYDEGLKRGVFMTKFNSTDLIFGKLFDKISVFNIFLLLLCFRKVWPGITAFPDFTNPKTIEWWT
ncbi:unnamed protein product, partial [Adineta steineri]